MHFKPVVSTMSVTQMICVIDTAPPMHVAYIIFPAIDVVNRRLLFLFLPRKEKIGDVIGVHYWWSVLSLKESGWGPPSSVLKMATHLQKSLFYFSVLFYFLFRKSGSELSYVSIFILLESQVRESAIPL